ncbi:30S ribosomal protein S1 [Treponema sp.]|uniref:30S ribosomal protein S1 n=1 Tax=Treponema sp. TaxID=166 RepID=UPI003F0DEB42
MKNLYEQGQMIETTVAAVSGDTVFINLGLKSEGFVSKAEFCDENGNCSVKEGDRIRVYFLGGKNDELHFTTKLSGQNAGKDFLENAFRNGVPVEGNVTKEIKGGFEVTVGTTRAFCPYSQMGYRQRKEPAEYIGQHLTFKIQEYKNDGKNIVLSNRAFLEEQSKAELETLSQKYTAGMTVTGKILSVESYGAFVDLNGFQALLPVSEISHARVENIFDVLKPGQEITAKIIRADWQHEKVSLSAKELETDPWENAEKQFPAGLKTEGKISRVADFGIFVNLAPGIDGLVHISKLNVDRGTNLKKKYTPGEIFPVTVEKVDAQEKRISLAPTSSSEEQDNADSYFSAHSNDDDGETYNPFAALLKNR